MCHFTPIALKRKPRKPAGFKHIARLEQRLAELEGLLGEKPLRKSTLLNSGSRHDQTTQALSLDTVAQTTPPSDSNSWMPTTESRIVSLDQPSNLGFNLGTGYREHDFSGPDVSILEGSITDRLAGTLPTQLRPISDTVNQQLPSKAFALELVHETFVNYNRFLPLFDEQDFLTEFQLKYSTSNPRDAGWWACLNVVLSIAHRLRSLRTLDPEHELAQASGHIQNALDVVSQLNVSNLSAVQALVGMACILQGTPNSEPAAMLVAAALRLAQAMNLHRDGSNRGLTEAEAEKRRRVFWKVYVLDKDVSLRTGRPFCQDDDDMDVRLPSKTGLDSSDVDIFNYRISLAMIQGQVYKQLYSIRAEGKTEAERAIAAQDLSSLLSYWKSNAQLGSPEGSTVSSASHVSGEMIHKVVLRLTYIHCLTMIDRHIPPTPPAANQLLSWSELLLLPGTQCLAESRKAIRLVEAIPPGDSSCVWMLLHAFLAAATSMLYNITQNPTSPNALSDLHLVKPFMRLLGMLAKGSGAGSRSEEIRRMHRTLSGLHDEANTAVQVLGSTSTDALYMTI